MQPGQYVLLQTKYGPRPHIVLAVSERGVIALNRETFQQRKLAHPVWRHHPPSESVNPKKIIARLRAALRERDKQFKGEPVRQAIKLMELYYAEARRTKGKRDAAKEAEGSPRHDEADSIARSVEAAAYPKALNKRRVPTRRARRRRAPRSQAQGGPFHLFEKHLKDA